MLYDFDYLNIVGQMEFKLLKTVDPDMCRPHRMSYTVPIKIRVACQKCEELNYEKHFYFIYTEIIKSIR